MGGWQAWDVFVRGQGQLRLGPDGTVIGLDLAGLMALGAALGYAADDLADYLPAAEAGFLCGLRQRTEGAES